jgi:hypothetical protein
MKWDTIASQHACSSKNQAFHQHHAGPNGAGTHALHHPLPILASKQMLDYLNVQRSGKESSVPCGLLTCLPSDSSP